MENFPIKFIGKYQNKEVWEDSKGVHINRFFSNGSGCINGCWYDYLDVKSMTEITDPKIIEELEKQLHPPKIYIQLKFESIHESPEGQIFIINFKENNKPYINDLTEDDLKVGEFFLHEGEKYEIVKRERFKKMFGDLPGDNIGLLVKKKENELHKRNI